MRFMLTFQIGLEEGNAAAKNGTLGQTIESILNEIQPEAAYFADIDGSRGGYLIINIDDASRIVAIAEPFFLGLGATIKLQPVMTLEELGRASEAFQLAAQKYG
jgi:hypothetical protein